MANNGIEKAEPDGPWSMIVLGWTCGEPCLVYTKAAQQTLPFKRLHQGEDFLDVHALDLRTYLISRSGMENILDRYFTGHHRWLKPSNVTSASFASLNHALAMPRSTYVTVPSLFTYKIMEHHHADGPFSWHSLKDFLTSTHIHVQKTIEYIYHLYGSDDDDEEEEDEEDEENEGESYGLLRK